MASCALNISTHMPINLCSTRCKAMPMKDSMTTRTKRRREHTRFAD